MIAALAPTPYSKLNISLWAAQAILALLFGLAGVMKSMMPIPELAEMLRWPGDVPYWLVRFIGIAELSGGLGIFLPTLTRIAPGLTPLAAMGFIFIQLLAIAFHATRGEIAMVGPLNAALLGLSIFVFWGRWKARPITPRA